MMRNLIFPLIPLTAAIALAGAIGWAAHALLWQDTPDLVVGDWQLETETPALSAKLPLPACVPYGSYCVTPNPHLYHRNVVPAPGEPLLATR
jgi:hypothetical protein